MQKFFFLCLGFVVICSIIACGNASMAPQSSYDDLIVGKWTRHVENLTQSISGDTLLTIDDTLLFNADNTCVISVRTRWNGKWHENVDYTGKWQVEGDSLYQLIGEAVSESSFKINLISEDSLVYSLTNNDDSVWTYRYYRVD